MKSSFTILLWSIIAITINAQTITYKPTMSKYIGTWQAEIGASRFTISFERKGNKLNINSQQVFIYGVGAGYGQEDNYNKIVWDGKGFICTKICSDGLPLITTWRLSGNYLKRFLHAPPNPPDNVFYNFHKV